ncbi:type VI secretion protein [Streptomyces sp. NPDC057638]|uniref:type VI secretion protein n=1 Tax=Streptomyces sp. NPDC057638 TaxID=3346190 RepID=UPI003686D4DF
MPSPTPGPSGRRPADRRRRYGYGYEGAHRPRHGPPHHAGHRGDHYGPEPGGRGGGVPDGLLIGVVGLVASLLVMVWTATGLAGLLAHGAWPTGVTLPRTPLALRSLVSAPADLAAAWPATPAADLSGYGLFWGLVIGEAMLLLVLAIFLLGTLARWRSVRAARHEASAAGPAKRMDRERTDGADGEGATAQDAPAPVSPAVLEPAPLTPPAPEPVPPAPRTPENGAAADGGPGPTDIVMPVPPPRAPRLLYGDPAARRPSAVRAVLEAEGPALVITSDPTVWDETKDTRAKLGPVLVYDPGHLCDTPARLHWSPTAHCERVETAAARAAALLAPVRPRALLDAAMADTAETLLRCWLHAAAVDGRPFKQVHRWAGGSGAQEAVRILRTSPKAASGQAGLLESALTAYPERRELAQQLVARTLSSLSSVHIRQACTPNRNDSLILESFVNEGGTLYVVGESIEDPKSQPGAMPLLTALASDVVEHGRRMAARSSSGRLDPPLTLVLDDVAAVAPLPALPELLTTGPALGLPTLALLRSPEQARARWQEPLPQ